MSSRYLIVKAILISLSDTLARYTDALKVVGITRYNDLIRNTLNASLSVYKETEPTDIDSTLNLISKELLLLYPIDNEYCKVCIGVSRAISNDLTQQLYKVGLVGSPYTRDYFRFSVSRIFNDGNVLLLYTENE